MFVRVHLLWDLTRLLKWCLVLGENPQETRIFVSYEALFAICFYCSQRMEHDHVSKMQDRDGRTFREVAKGIKIVEGGGSLDIIDHKNWKATFVYAYLQKQLWTVILDLKPRGFEALILMGDFNNICTTSEKLRGSSTVPFVLAEFNDFINDCEVLSLNVVGIPFT
ncbi:unnamed protein product, partial [Prunus brigantina]